MFALNYGENCAVLTSEKSVTYRELKQLSHSLAAYAKPRSIVLVIASNTLDCLVGYVGFLNKGVVPLMLSATTAREAIVEIVELYQPEYVWAPSSHAVYEQAQAAPIATCGEYCLRMNERCTAPSVHEDLALLLSTSGSTGSKKLVRISRTNLLSNAESIISYLGISEDERAITTLPLSYTYGLSIIHSHFLAGASIILTEATLFDRTFWQLLKEYCATSFGGVPYTYAMLKQLRFARMELPSLRYLTQAGGRLGVELHQEFAELCAEKGIDFVVMYGQTEATARISYLPSQYAVSKVGSIGIAIPNGEVLLLNEEGSIIFGSHTSGELVYRGPNVSLGYASKRSDCALGDTRHGELYTGDIAERDEDGFYYIVGRKKRFLKIFGNRVNLDELEGLLKKEGMTAAATGEDDTCLIVIESSGSSVLDEEHARRANTLLEEKTGLSKSIFTVCLIGRLPRNESGKILYAELNECYG